MNLRKYKTTAERKKMVEREFGINLTNIGSFTLDEQRASKKNCENMIGAVQVPIGVAGPLTITGDQANGAFILPLATTEGTLIASVSRGCKAISLSGSVNVYACRVGQTRGPVFEVRSLAERKKLSYWIKTNEKRLIKTAEKK